MRSLRRISGGFDDLTGVWPEIAAWAPAIREQIEIEAAYAGYLDRQRADVAAFRRDEALALPAELDYRSVGGLSGRWRRVPRWPPSASHWQRRPPLPRRRSIRCSAIAPSWNSSVRFHSTSTMRGTTCTARAFEAQAAPLMPKWLSLAPLNI